MICLHLLHYIAVHRCQVGRSTIGVSLILISQDVYEEHLDVSILVAVPCHAGNVGRVAVEEPVVDTRTLDIERCDTIEEQRAFDTHCQVVGGVGADVLDIIFFHFFAVEFEHHTVGNLEVAGYGTFTIQQTSVGGFTSFVIYFSFFGYRHTHGIGVVRRHLSFVDDV